MGRANAELIRSAEKARKLHGADSHQFKKLAKLVDQSQADCAHDGEIRTKNGVRFCMECSKVLDA